MQLPDGRTGRAASLLFLPKVDEEAELPITPERVRLVVVRETAALDSEISFLRKLLTGVTGGTIVLALLVGVAVVYRGLRPMRTLASRISSIKQDDLSVRLPTKRIPTELAPVVERLNDLLERLEDAFRRERAFTADAAHELRTPLAGLRSVMEVALTRPRTDDEYKQALTECLDIARRTQAMTDNLLELARLDSGQATFKPETLRLAELVEGCWRYLASDSVRRGITFEARIPASLECEADRDSLMTTLSILLTNAAEYTNDGGLIEVAAVGRANLVELTVSNSGCRLSTEQIKHVFERFWRGDASRTNTGIHCGLGLATARHLVTALDGEIDARVNGNIFSVRLKLSRSPTRVEGSDI